MIITKCNKLVRDNVPQIIEKAGKVCVVETLDGKEYMDNLMKKLQEEVAEFLYECNKENDEEAIKELADITEVIYAIVEEIGMDIKAFERIRKAKKLKSGGFEKKILLKEVIEI